MWPQLETEMYFSFRGEENQIWLIPGEGSEPAPIFQMPLQLTLAEAERAKLLLPEEASAMREYHATGPPAWLPSADDIPLDIGIWSLSLSPGGEFLAWNETYEWETGGNVDCGEQLVRVMNLNSLEVTIAAHTSEIFGPPVWSPDGRKIAFHQVSRSVGRPNPSVWVYEIEAGILGEIGQGFEPTWAPDSARLAAEHMAAGFPMESLGLRILSPQDPPVSVDLGPWDNPQRLAWSPAGDQLAFIAPLDHQGVLLVLDLSTREIRRLPGVTDYDGVVGWPVWSPDGRLLAVVAQTKSGKLELLVLDANNGSPIMKPIPAGNYYHFFNEPSIEWSPEGLGLLVLAAPSHEELQADGRTLYIYEDTSTESFVRGQFVRVGVPDGELTAILFHPTLEESPDWISGPTSFAW
jgi:WD40 repeat protein